MSSDEDILGLAELAPDERQRLATLARLMHATYTRRLPLPSGWVETGRRGNPLTGVNAAAFRHPGTGEVVVAIKGVNAWDIRDLIFIAVHRTIGYGESAVQLVRKLIGETDSDVTIIGHSAGGGLASWLGERLAVATVTFNAGRTRSSLANSGRRQVNVCIRGDRWGDPWRGFYRMPLPGRYVVLDRRPGSGNRHLMPAVVTALERSSASAVATR